MAVEHADLAFDNSQTLSLKMQIEQDDRKTQVLPTTIPVL